MMDKILRIPKCTAGKLRKALERLPNDAPVELIAPPIGDDWSRDIRIERCGDAYEIFGYWHDDDSADLERNDVETLTDT